MAEGMSNAAIAARLVVTVKTVESHIANIFTKLGLHDDPSGNRRVLAVLEALRHGGGSR
jgi:DNA-binding NarL/FixJ family response regulator